MPRRGAVAALYAAVALSAILRHRVLVFAPQGRKKSALADKSDSCVIE